MFFVVGDGELVVSFVEFVGGGVRYFGGLGLWLVVRCREYGGVE